MELVHSIEWHEERRRGIGGSDAATIVGHGFKKTPLDLWRIKTAQTEPEDLSENEKVLWGTILETPIADEFARRHPEITVRRRTAAVWSKRWPFALAHLDRRGRTADARLIIEIKTVGYRAADHWGESGTTDIPDYYLPQVMHEIAVDNADGAWVVALIGGQDYREYFIPRNDAYIEWLMEQERIFWECVVENVPPAPINKYDVYELHPDPSGSVEADELTIKRVARLAEVRHLTKNLKAEEEAIADELAILFGEHDIMTANGRKIATFKAQDRDGYDMTRLVAEQPDIAAQYVAISHFRVLRVS
jgi:putative phage-type endonuclease